MLYFYIFITSVLLSFILTLTIRRVALFFKVQDVPSERRKKHSKPIPLLGGVAPFLAFFSVIFALFCFSPLLPLYKGELEGVSGLFKPIFWLFIASTIIIVGGFFDDKWRLKPKFQIIWPILAILVVLYGGIRADVLTNPLGGVIQLGFWASLGISFFWLLMVTYTTKILDGLDGLVSGIVPLGALTIFLFTTLTDFKEAGLSYIALVLAGVFIGFLFLNF
ncbi:undecaprenyl/decaprenyl-phosphate alpha-N-acetylglucosaminyl 1-phosphate transferase, partial [Patescibacteria group bacterium]|nr:undecaprenyl/decaprenyl-phosphate alpha-N-acetylglucosaminyl 1-phosphate transferase [Patescibacteria group bacterium]